MDADGQDSKQSFLKTVENFLVEWDLALKKSDSKKIYILLLKFLKNLLKNKKALSQSGNLNALFRILHVFNKDFPSILEKNFEKTERVSGILDNYYSKAFNSLESSLNGFLDGQDSRKNSEDFQEKLKKLQKQEKSKEKFFVKKYRDVLETNATAFLDLYTIGEKNQLANDSAEIIDLTQIIRFLIGIFPDLGGEMIKRMVRLFDLQVISKKNFVPIVRKSMDNLPYPIIFALVNHIQELVSNFNIRSKTISPHDIEQIACILTIFVEYAEYYPNYFAAHINLYYGLVDRFHNIPQISLEASRLLIFFAKQADERVNQLFFDLYKKVPELKGDIQCEILNVLGEALSNGEEYVLSNYLDDEGLAVREKFKNNVYKNLSSESIGIKEISFELAIAIWKIEIKRNLEEKGDSLFFKVNRKRLFKPIRKLLKRMISDRIDSPFLFLQSVRDCDEVLETMDKDYEYRALEKEFTKEKKINTPEKLFSSIEAFRKRLKNV